MKKYKTNELECQHIFALISGTSGIGKTYSFGTLPEKETIILSLESGLLTLNDKSIDVWQIDSVSDLITAFNDLKSGNHPYKHVAVDSLTELSDMIFSDLKPKFSKAQTFDLYRVFSERMIEMLKMFRDMTAFNTWFSVQLRDGDNNEDILDVAQKTLGRKIPSFFDFSFYIKCFEKDNKIVRTLCTDSTVISFCKSRSKKIELYEPVDLTAITNKILTTNKGN